MKTPDLEALEANRQTAAVVLEATRLLVAYLEESPSPRRRLSDRLVDTVAELTDADLGAGAFREAGDVAGHLATWIAKCLNAVERPWMPEDEES